MQFRIGAIFYVMALLAASLAGFGPSGCVASIFVLAIWLMALDWPIDFPTKLGGALLGTIIGIVAGVYLFAEMSAHTQSPRNSCKTNLKQIVLALQNYHDVHGSFPPAYVADKNGRPMHSWRVLILPYIEEQELYKAYNFNEPWDGQNNKKLAKQIPDVFRCPSTHSPETRTNYLAVVGPTTAFPGSKATKLSDFVGDPAKKILVVESEKHAVNWMQPTDLSYEEALAILTATTSKQADGHNYGDAYRGYSVALGDGQAAWFGYGAVPEVTKRWLSIAEDQPAESEEEYIDFTVETIALPGKSPRDERISENRKHGFSLVLCVIIAFLPMPWAIRARRERGVQATDDA